VIGVNREGESAPSLYLAGTTSESMTVAVLPTVRVAIAGNVLNSEDFPQFVTSNRWCPLHVPVDPTVVTIQITTVRRPTSLI